MGNSTDDGTNQFGEIISATEVDVLITDFTDFVLVIDGEGDIRTVAETGMSPLEYPDKHLVGGSITDLFAASAASDSHFDVNTTEAFENSILTGEKKKLTVPFERATGTVVPVVLSVIPREETDEILCLGWEVDVQIPADNQLFNAVADPVFVLDSESRFERVNDAMIEYTGYKRGELLGRKITELVPAGTYDEVTTQLAKFVKDGSRNDATIEMSVISDTGDLIVAEANLTVRTDRSGEYAGSVGVLRDIRERKRRERNLELLKQVLARVFRHNVRNELLVAEAHAELLNEQVGADLQEHTAEIRRSADKLLEHSEKARLIQKVIETEKRYEQDITASVEVVSETLKEQYPAAIIDVDIPEECRVYAHAYIDKAIEELIENALEHAPADGPATLSIWLDRQGERPTLFIEDESGGLADHEMEVLQKGDEGALEHSSGVGLWLVRWLVEYSAAEMIAHRTDAGTLMGIRFSRTGEDQERSAPDIEEAPLAKPPGYLRDVTPDRFRGETVIERVEALEELEERYTGLKRKGGHTILITGEAGIGKTTLVNQFRERLTQQKETPVVARGTCEGAVQPPYHAFRQVLRELPIERDISELLVDVGSLAAEDATELQQRKRALFADIADELRVVAMDEPVVLIIEDMQWADSGTIALFEYLVDEVGRWGNPVLFVGTYRTSDVEREHPVIEVTTETAEAGRGTVIELEPFGLTDVETLLSYMLNIQELPSSFVEAVYHHTGGTPLFVNEIGRHLAETLEPIQLGAELPTSLENIAVPDTVERAVTNRLDELPAEVRSVVQLGAIIGREFSFDVLRMASEMPADSLIECIDTLTRRQIWNQSADGLEFVHGVIREQTLSAIDDETRRRMHRNVAQAIETVHEGALETYAAQLATHYEVVGDYSTAYEYHRKAGDHASETYAHDDAVDHYKSALTLSREHEAIEKTDQPAVSTELGAVYELLGELRRAREYYEQSLDSSRREGDRQGEAASLHDLGSIARRRGNYEQAREHHERSLSISVAIGDRKGEASSLQGLGRIAFRQSRYDQARAYHEQSLQIQAEIGDRNGEAKSLHNLGNIALREGEYDRATEYYEQSIDLKRDTGDRKGESASLNNLGTIATQRGKYNKAREYYERGLEIKREIGDRNGEGTSLHNLGIVAEYQGAYSQARTYYKESLEIDRETGDLAGEATSLHNLGIIAYRRSEYGRAREYCEESLEIKRELGDRQGEATTLQYLGEVRTRQGQYERARGYFRESLEIKREIGDQQGEAVSLRGLGQLALRRGAPEKASEFLTDALEIAQEIDASEPEIGSLRILGAVARKQGEFEQAHQYLEECLGACDENGDFHHRVKTQLERGRLALARKDFSTAREAVERARDTLTKLETSHDEARAAVLEGRIAAATESPVKARECWQSALETFERIDAPQDTLLTLRYLVELAHKQGEEQERKALSKQARNVLQNAPRPVKERYSEWPPE